MRKNYTDVTRYVYGRGLIGEERDGSFKTYHFDGRGSTVAITNESGAVTDTFAYDTYGKLISRTGTSKVIFGYNGRDGVVTDENGLLYMRARYYSPALRRFINADIVAGSVSNAITLNRFAYANGNPVSFVDPFGLFVKSFSIGLGSISIDLITGGWEGEYVDLSLLDFGHAEAGLEFENGNFNVGAMASVWSPSFSVNIGGVNIEIGVEVGAVGMSGGWNFSTGKNEVGFSVGGGVGFSFNAWW